MVAAIPRTVSRTESRPAPTLACWATFLARRWDRELLSRRRGPVLLAPHDGGGDRVDRGFVAAVQDVVKYSDELGIGHGTE
jgi:hypothetical protein